ncbi:polysaccharide biosynthesis/export family protein [Mucilaginibacter sp.]|jgi:polysaccharide export outer membrane protein|uniref:polysaccharide biosynthesis/export family protein n=1 Tax=Mucilaginibacter sp. TaxID=1882438 RepID=UPI002D0A1483|nr:polysaccharide biosynthesis/export family protein [Mucilaginibacter sp.]HTI60967.1 polysaccharide biosynthesis/export family protein [Mucilaginibacter sp.]
MRFYTALSTTLLFFSIIIFQSCSTKQQQILFQQQMSAADSLKQISEANAGSGTSDYHIQSQDILQIRNLQNARYIVDATPSTVSAGGASLGASGTTSGEGQSYQVQDDGTVALPLIGHVQVAGLTRAEAQKKIEAIYSKDVLVNPIIDLKITNLKVTILGEVKAQGNYPLIKDKTNLIELIGEAGGFTDKANEKTVKIIRGDPKKPQVTELDLSQVKTLADPRIILKNNDIIYIAQNKRAIKSDNLQSVTTTLQPALIILNTALIIYTLIHR